MIKLYGYFVFMVDGSYIAVPTCSYVEENEIKAGIVSPRGSHIQLGKKIAAKLNPATPEEVK